MIYHVLNKQFWEWDLLYIASQTIKYRMIYENNLLCFFSVLQYAVQIWLQHGWWCVVLPTETLHIAHEAEQDLENMSCLIRLLRTVKVRLISQLNMQLQINRWPSYLLGGFYKYYSFTLNVILLLYCGFFLVTCRDHHWCSL